MSFLRNLIEAFFPFRCHICSEKTSLGQVICSGCLNSISRSLKQPVVVSDTVCGFPVLTLSAYDFFASETIRLIKYRPSVKLLQKVVALIDKKNLLKDLKNEKHVFVPVPMHKKRLKKRGFNQAEILAESFARMTNGYYSPVLLRSFATRPQASCSEEERLVNLDNAMRLKKNVKTEAFKGKRIVIVDDVATTGTTLNCCYQILKKIKPEKIFGLVVSHSFKKITRS